MQALWLENKLLSLRDLPVPQTQPGDALIKLRMAGICGTDLELLRGYYPFQGIPGHEFVGDVITASDPNWIGKRVVGEINISCGKCQECLDRNSNHCEYRSTVGIRGRSGVFVEYFLLPESNLHLVPKNVPDPAAVFTEPLAAALEILTQVSINPKNNVLIIGSGRLGLLIAQVIAHAGCNLVVTARQPKARMILEGFNIHTIYPDDIPVRKMDIVIEASGSPGGFDLALRAIRPKGKLVLKSTYVDSIHMNISALVVDEITLIGSRCGPFEQALHSLETQQIDTAPLLEAQYFLQDGISAFNHAAMKGALKILLKP